MRGIATEGRCSRRRSRRTAAVVVIVTWTFSPCGSRSSSTRPTSTPPPGQEPAGHRNDVFIAKADDFGVRPVTNTVQTDSSPDWSSQ